MIDLQSESHKSRFQFQLVHRLHAHLPIREAIAATPRAHIIKLDLQAKRFRIWRARLRICSRRAPTSGGRTRSHRRQKRPHSTVCSSFSCGPGLTERQGSTPDLVRPGTPVAIDGPLGSFTFPAHPRERRFVFIAGGTGIAPLRSMLWHTLLAERDGHVALIYSVRAPEEFAYMEEFQRLEDEGRIEFRHTVTRAAAEGWPGRQGRIDVAMSGWT